MTTYKAIVTLKNGAHKIVRMTRDKVAKIVTEFRRMQKNIFSDVVLLTIGDVTLVLNDCKSFKFINEYTLEQLVVE